MGVIRSGRLTFAGAVATRTSAYQISNHPGPSSPNAPHCHSATLTGLSGLCVQDLSPDPCALREFEQGQVTVDLELDRDLASPHPPAGEAVVAVGDQERLTKACIIKQANKSNKGGRNQIWGEECLAIHHSGFSWLGVLSPWEPTALFLCAPLGLLRGMTAQLLPFLNSCQPAATEEGYGCKPGQPGGLDAIPLRRQPRQPPEPLVPGASAAPHQSAVIPRTGHGTL